MARAVVLILLLGLMLVATGCVAQRDDGRAMADLSAGNAAAIVGRWDLAATDGTGLPREVFHQKGDRSSLDLSWPAADRLRLVSVVDGQVAFTNEVSGTFEAGWFTFDDWRTYDLPPLFWTLRDRGARIGLDAQGHLVFDSASELSDWFLFIPYTRKLESQVRLTLVRAAAHAPATPAPAPAAP